MSVLVILNGSIIYSQAYADDVTFPIIGPFISVVCRKAQGTLNMFDTWCSKNVLPALPTKTSVVFFTRRKMLDGFVSPTLIGITIQISSEVKYLGVILESKLLWTSQVEQNTSKGSTAFWQC